jgi:tetratricopeptide (TPR) repeat protein
LGRFEQARATLTRECRLAKQRNDALSATHCQLQFAFLTVLTGSFRETPQYLEVATQLMGAAPADSPPMLMQAALQGSVDLANGRLSEARTQFQQALAGKDVTPTRLYAQLGMAELELAAGNPAAALRESRDALQAAVSLQGGLPYSCRTGLAWLTIGRALEQLGDSVLARKALETAIAHLSNTVDANHPALLQAQRLLSASL